MQKVDVIGIYNVSAAVTFKFRVMWKIGDEKHHSDWTSYFSSGDYDRIDLNECGIPAGTTVWPQIDPKAAVDNDQEPSKDDYVIFEPHTENVGCYYAEKTVNNLNIQLFK